MAPAPLPENAADDLSFEAALERLERIVQRLESASPGLDESLACYQEGVRLAARCRTLLEDAQRTVALLSGVDEEGQPETQPFDASATLSDEPARPSRPGRGRSAPL